MRIFITGASGGLGRGLCKYFIENGFEIIANGRNQIIGEKLKSIGCDFINGDICETDFAPYFENIDYIIHAAAISSPWGLKKDFINTNVNATEKIIIAAKQAKVKGMIFISSPSIYSSEKDQLNIDCKTEFTKMPLNDYAASKIMAEDIIKQHINKNFKAIIIRPRAIICENDNVLLPRFLRIINKGFFPLFNKGKTLIEPTDIRDIFHAIDCAIKNIDKLNGQDFNISSGKAIELKSMILMLATAMKKPVKFIEIDYKIARKIVFIIEQICNILPNKPEPPITKYSLAALTFSQTFNLEKAKNLLGYIPQYDAFESAVEIAKNIGLNNGKN